MSLIGRTIDNKYRIRKLIGNGGMGEVYQGFHGGLQRQVAIKVIHPYLAAQDDFRQRFLNEARTVAQLDHPSIVHVYDSGVAEGGVLYMVMEFVGGGTLAQHLLKVRELNGQFDLREALLLLAQSADALAYAHRLNPSIIHRDIKPDNILLKQVNQPNGLPARTVITDFGLAKAVEAEDGRTVTGTFIGTPAYMSPEQCRGDRLDGRADIYSLGIVLYQIVTGRLPFQVNSPAQAITMHLYEPPPPPTSIRPDLPPSVVAVIEQALAKKPSDRFRTATQMAARLRQVAGELSADPATVSLVTQMQERLAAAPPDFDSSQLQPASFDRIVILAHGLEPEIVPLQGDAVIGRAADADIQINTPMISRQHAQLNRNSTGWSITDLDSNNGTYLDDNLLVSGQPTAIGSHQTIRVANRFLRVIPAMSVETIPPPVETLVDVGQSVNAAPIWSAHETAVPTHIDSGQAEQPSARRRLPAAVIALLAALLAFVCLGGGVALADFDDDGLANYQEILLGTGMRNPDSDGDGSADGRDPEPLIAALIIPSTPTLTPTPPPTATLTPNLRETVDASDEDEDGLSLAEEQSIGTSPTNPDTDGDGLSDFVEIKQHGTNPLKLDTDDDSINDNIELANGTNPNRADSDGDGLNDNVDPDPGSLPTVTPLPTNLPTATSTPTATQLPSLTPTPTNTPTPSLTPTPRPTFDASNFNPITCLSAEFDGQKCTTARTTFPPLLHEIYTSYTIPPAYAGVNVVRRWTSQHFDNDTSPKSSSEQFALLYAYTPFVLYPGPWRVDYFVGDQQVGQAQFYIAYPITTPNPSQALVEYWQLVSAGEYEAAWLHLSTNFQQRGGANGSLTQYISGWASVCGVDATNLDSGNVIANRVTVEADITFRSGSGCAPNPLGRLAFEMVFDQQKEIWQIDSAEVIGE